ncbi:hypothetical protein OZX61_12515 (plasmid) [Acinetobacter sp. ESL0695]|uniref:hypothetical protein n=1 Tax=Acinetobacter sp. ESL0695 TaxID=2983215 RepID=UPI0023F1AA5A|nr:hypothetical protein [Acinetobacter sp. ESL0695]WEV50119.1 hypothetical protein OZX61_12325 [Acinetobacter sp. ESL0695]WEV50199.1 hypothetical protein OZX61_12515 [Acinetobacter sp. ESL0695]
MISTITYATGVAISKDNFYLASVLDALDHWDYYARMFVYKHKESGKSKWTYHDLDGWGLVSTAFNEDPRQLITLNSEGDIEVYTAGNVNYSKVIPNQEDHLIYGSFTCLKVLDFGIYVCGSGGKVYQRTSEGWGNISFNLEEPIIDTRKTIREDFFDLNKRSGYEISLYGLAGFAEDQLYVCGRKGDRGFIAYFNGEQWVEIDAKTPSTLNDICICENQTDVIITGEYGTLLQGNVQSGFKNLKDMGISTPFYKAAYYNDVLYITSEDGLFRYENNIYSKVNEVKNIRGTSYIEAKEGVLWVVADKELIRFDGENWEIIHHPDNEEETSNRLKCYAGDRCPESGDWYSPHQVEKRYFAKGDVMPEIENNTWGETIWYLDI